MAKTDSKNYPTVIKPQLAENASVKPDELVKYEATHFAQEKLDGTRVIVVRDGAKTHLMSRSWKNDFAPEYTAITAEMATLPDATILDGELVFHNANGARVFIAATAKEGREGLTATLMLFDVLAFAGENKRELAQVARSEFVEALVAKNTWKAVSFIPRVEGGFKALFEGVTAKGGEGIMLKDKAAIYRDDKRVKTWRKVKREETHDCFVMGLSEGEGKYAHQFGALIIGQYVNGNMQIVAKCSGMEDAMRAKLFEEVMALPTKTDCDVAMWKGYHLNVLKQVDPKIVIEVKCMERFDNGIMRHPVFIQVRNDKGPAECTFEA